MLVICGTPIGNLEDVSLRLLNTLQTSDLIAAEDTRRTQKLLNHFDIKTPMTSYHEHNKKTKAPELVEKMMDDPDFQIALVTDAGMPAISDPGEYIVALCIANKVHVTSVPGPTAVTTALALSGLPTKQFVFDGFLPRDNKKRNRMLAAYEEETRTIVLYESPHHLVRTLEDLNELYPDKQMAALRELTKKHEEKVRGKVSLVYDYFKQNEPRGEFVLVLEGKDYKELEQEEQAKWEKLSVKAHVEMYMNEEGLREKEAMKKAAADRGISNKEIYRIYKINVDRE